jgi:thymidylate synthase
MTVLNLIACVAKYKNKLMIGDSGNLLVRLKEDLKHFSAVTKVSQLSRDVLPIVVMGRKTFESLPDKKPLKDRINVVLTFNKGLLKGENKLHSSYNLKKLDPNVPYYTTYQEFDRYLKDNDNLSPSVYVIGGGEIYNLFTERNDISRIYLTEVKGVNFKNVKYPVYMNGISDSYKMTGFSDTYIQDNYTYRILRYTKKIERNYYSSDKKYTDLAREILDQGKDREDRTGTGTKSVFGRQLRFDISNGSVPLLTVKSVPFKAIVAELFWMMSGNTCNDYLTEKNVKIWNGNTSREFLDSRNLQHYPEGTLGPGYGFQIRNFGGDYNPEKSDTRKHPRNLTGTDQLKYVEDLLDKDPYSRRILMSYWNPCDLSKTALVPCHFQIQFYVEEIDNIKYLSSHFNMRSSDELARSWNVVFYTLLTQILALRHNMRPKEIVFSISDAHIYKNHIGQVQSYIDKVPAPEPKVHLSETLKDKSWEEMEIQDVELIGYFPHPSIKMEMSV